MKKVIIITISMLAVFSVLVGVSANQLTDRWQTPLQDEIELTVSSPVEMVEKEYKEYPYIVDTDSGAIEIVQEGMLTYAEAASSMGSVLELAMPTLDMSAQTAKMGLYSYSQDETKMVYVMRYGDNSTRYGESIDIAADAYTGDVVFVRIYATPENNVEDKSFAPPLDETEFLNAALFHLTLFGTEVPQKYIVTKNSTSYYADENYVGKRAMFLMGDYVSQIDWSYNEQKNIFTYIYGYDNGDMPVVMGYTTEALKNHISANGKEI